MLSEGITPKWAQYSTIIDAVWDSYQEKGYELFRRGLDEYGTFFQEERLALGHLPLMARPARIITKAKVVMVLVMLMVMTLKIDCPQP